MHITIIRPPVVQGSRLVHERAMTSIKTACEQGYFTRNGTGKAKPEVKE